MTTYSAQPMLTWSGLLTISAITSRKASTEIAATTPTKVFCFGSSPTPASSPARTEARTARPRPSEVPLAASPRLPEVGGAEGEHRTEAEQVHAQTESRDRGEQDERQPARTCGRLRGGLRLRRLLVLLLELAELLGGSAELLSRLLTGGISGATLRVGHDLSCFCWASLPATHCVGTPFMDP